MILTLFLALTTTAPVKKAEPIQRFPTAVERLEEKVVACNAELYSLFPKKFDPNFAGSPEIDTKLSECSGYLAKLLEMKAKEVK
jgi:hypothetical protein